MRLQSRLHQATEVRADAWIFQNGRPERIRHILHVLLDVFNHTLTLLAFVLLLVFWIGIALINAALPLNP